MSPPVDEMSNGTTEEASYTDDSSFGSCSSEGDIDQVRQELSKALFQLRQQQRTIADVQKELTAVTKLKKDLWWEVQDIKRDMLDVWEERESLKLKLARRKEKNKQLEWASGVLRRKIHVMSTKVRMRTVEQKAEPDGTEDESEHRRPSMVRFALNMQGSCAA